MHSFVFLNHSSTLKDKCIRMWSQKQLLSRFLDCYDKFLHAYCTDLRKRIVFTIGLFMSRVISATWRRSGLVLLASVPLLEVYCLFQLQYVRGYYKEATKFSDFKFKFMEEEIVLELPKNQNIDNWIIRPRTFPCTVSYGCGDTFNHVFFFTINDLYSAHIL